MARIAIQAVKLGKWFGEEPTRTQAVKDASFEANFGEMLYVVGPSGSGKTTMLSMVSGILRPSAGIVRVEDTDIWRLSVDQLADFRPRKIGFVFQDYHLFPRLTTAENVAIPLILQNREWTHALEEARPDLEIVGHAASASCAWSLGSFCGPGLRRRPEFRSRAGAACDALRCRSGPDRNSVGTGHLAAIR